jgi:recombination protein RecA
MIQTETPTKPEDILKAAQCAVGELDKEYGKGTVVRLGDKPIIKVPVIPSGLYNLDYEVLGVGGFPRGRIIEIFGPESSGKTTLALRIVAEAQKRGELAAFIDMEHALDPTWAGTNGVDVDNLFVSQPDYGEQALEVAKTLILSKAFSVVVVDSVAALVPKAELEGDMGDSFMGVQSRLMSQAMRVLNTIVSKTNCTLIFINQIREKIGVMFGSPETTTGGRALKFYASVRIDVRKKEVKKAGEMPIGHQVKFKAVKNKVSAPFRETEETLLFETGFDTDGSMFDGAVTIGIVQKAGAWYSYKGEKIGQGRDNALAMVKSTGQILDINEEVSKAHDGAGSPQTA